MGTALQPGQNSRQFRHRFFHRDGLSAQDRWWSKDANLRNVREIPAPWNGLPVIDANGATVRDNDFDNRSSISPFGSWIRGLPTADGGFAGARPTANRGISTTQPSPYLTLSTAGAFYLSPLADGSVGFRQTAPSRSIDGVEKDFFYNVNLGTSLANKTDRWQAATFVDHKLGGGVDLFADLVLYRATSTLGRTPLDGRDRRAQYRGRDQQPLQSPRLAVLSSAGIAQCRRYPAPRG